MATQILFDGLAGCERFATTLARCIELPMVISLNGTLGSGKTTWTQKFAQAFGIDERDVTSPTFVLVHRYEGTSLIFHLDAYRVRDEDEFLELGVEEMFESDAISIVEWGDRVRDTLPKDRIEITLEIVSEKDRKAILQSTGDRSAIVIARFQEEWSRSQ